MVDSCVCMFGFGHTFRIFIKGLIRRITRFKRPLWNIMAGLILSFAVFCGTLYSLNFYIADETSAVEYSAAVLSKFSEEHYHVRRISRNRVRRGEKYKVYYINIALPDGRSKKIEVPVSEFIRIKEGKRIKLLMETGLFGIPVIKNLSFPVRHRAGSGRSKMRGKSNIIGINCLIYKSY